MRRPATNCAPGGYDYVSAPGSQGAIARPRTYDWGRLTVLFSNPWVWVGALTVVAFVLRRFHLGAESLWFDEADIVERARQPISVLVNAFTQAGENGPLYTLLLHFWVAAIESVPGFARVGRVLFGYDTEAVIRGLPAIFGTAAIPLMYALGRRVGGPLLGLVGAVLLTFNPFHIWYSQDAKMYTLLVLLTLASTILYIDALRRNTIALWAGYVVVTWVMLTVHSMSGLVLLAQLVATPLIWAEARRQSAAESDGARSGRALWVRWGWAMLLIFLPLFPIAWLRLAALVTDTADLGGWYSPTGLTDILSTIFVKFAVNQADPPWETVGGIAMVALALLGVVALLLWRSKRGEMPASDSLPEQRDEFVAEVQDASRRPRSRYVPLVIALWIVPVVLFWLVTLKVPLFQPRYLIMSLPPYLLAAAAGLLFLRRLHPALLVVGVVAVAAPTVFALAQVNYSPEVQKEDWRGAMAYIQDHLRLRDEIFVFPGYMETAVDYYYQPGGPGDVPKVDIKTIPSLGTKDFGPNDINAALLEAAKCHERAWLVVSPPREEQEDSKHQVQEWFQYNWHTFDTRVFNGVTVYGIAFNGQPQCWYPEPTHKELHTFSNGLQFLGYIYELRNQSTANDQPDASYFPLTMYWRNGDKLATDYDVRATIKDPLGKVVVDQALGPLNGYWPTSQWPAHNTVIDYRDLRLPGGLTPGDYTVSVQLYPKGHPDQPLTLPDGSSEITFKAPLKVVPWNGK